METPEALSSFSGVVALMLRVEDGRLVGWSVGMVWLVTFRGSRAMQT